MAACHGIAVYPSDQPEIAAWAAAVGSEGGINPTVTLALGLMTLLGLTIAPIAVALINRGGRSRPLNPELLPPDVVMPRRQYDELLDQFARADDENDRLNRELRHVREARDQAEDEREQLRMRLEHAISLLRMKGVSDV